MLKKCQNCGRDYTFLASYSGWIPDPDEYDTNSTNKYCGKCAPVIKKALLEIPVERECKYLNINEFKDTFSGITIERLQEWEKLNDDEIKNKNNGLLIKRVYPGLFNWKTEHYNSISDIRGRDEFEKYKFRLSLWVKDGVVNLDMDHSISVLCEVDMNGSFIKFISKQFYTRQF
jgi:hypothetical protein